MLCNKTTLVRAAVAAISLTTPLLLAAEPPPASLEVDLSHPGAQIGPLFYGLMTEEINHSYDGGLYAELIQNRTFKDDAKNPVHWSLVQDAGGSASIALDESQPINDALTTCLKLNTGALASGERAGIANDGFWGVPIKPGMTYRASFYARASQGVNGPLAVSLESGDGGIVYARAQGPAVSAQWQRYTVTLTMLGTVQPSNSGRFVISTGNPGTYWFNLVSLFPPTFHNRPNGNRIDIMQHLADLKPAFLRCPGGNYLEGNSVDTRFQWEKTLGDISTRPGHMGCWSYRSSDGLGLLEFMEWAEDMGSEPVLAVYAGFSLSTHDHPRGTAVPAGPALQPFVQEALDEIEYVTGDVSSKWGARRAQDGHPAPFPLHYVEIGNEDFFGDAKSTYNARFAQFYDALKAAYPNLRFIATIPITGRTPDAVDDHYYKTSDEMANLAHRYDKQDRNGPKVFVGEWATRELAQTAADGTVTFGTMPWDYKGAPTPDLHAALGDAAFMTGLERNADVVVMNCYAPLLVRIDPGAFQWCPNLIGYDSLRSYVSPSWYAQQMFNLNRGDTVLNATMRGDQKDIFFSATRSTQRGDVYLKVVNRSAAAQTVTIDLNGASKISPDGVSVVLTSSSPQDTNTINAPDKVVPVTAQVHIIAPSFTYTFPAYSVTVLQLKSL